MSSFANIAGAVGVRVDEASSTLRNLIPVKGLQRTTRPILSWREKDSSAARRRNDCVKVLKRT